MTLVGIWALSASFSNSSQCLSRPPFLLGRGTGSRGPRDAVGSFVFGLRAASASCSGVSEGTSWRLSSSIWTLRRILSRLMRRGSSESLRKFTWTARTPPSKGDFLENFSLYCEATVQGSADMVRPSWDSREAVLRESWGGAVVARGGERSVAAVMKAMVQAEKCARTWFRIGL